MPNFELLRDPVKLRQPHTTAMAIMKEEPCQQQHERSHFKDQAGNHGGAVPGTKALGNKGEIRIWPVNPAGKYAQIIKRVSAAYPDMHFAASKLNTFQPPPESGVEVAESRGNNSPPA